MPMNRWVQSSWSFRRSDSDNEDDKVKFFMSTPEWPSTKRVLENHPSSKSKNKLIDLLGSEYLTLLAELDEEEKCRKMISAVPRKPRMVPKCSMVEEEAENEEDVFDADEDLKNFNRYHRISAANPKEDHQKNKQIAEKQKLEDTKLFKKYNHIGTGNWGEDVNTDFGQKDKRRRSTMPYLNIPPR